MADELVTLWRWDPEGEVTGPWQVKPDDAVVPDGVQTRALIDVAKLIDASHEIANLRLHLGTTVRNAARLVDRLVDKLDDKTVAWRDAVELRRVIDTGREGVKGAAPEAITDMEAAAVLAGHPEHVPWCDAFVMGEGPDAQHLPYGDRDDFDEARARGMNKLLAIARAD